MDFVDREPMNWLAQSNADTLGTLRDGVNGIVSAQASRKISRQRRAADARCLDAARSPESLSDRASPHRAGRQTIAGIKGVSAAGPWPGLNILVRSRTPLPSATARISPQDPDAPRAEVNGAMGRRADSGSSFSYFFSTLLVPLCVRREAARSSWDERSPPLMKSRASG